MKNTFLKSVIISLLFLMTGKVWGQVNDYPWQNSTCNTAGDIYGMYYKNCTSWVAWKINQNQDNNPTTSPYAFFNNMYGSGGSATVCNPTSSTERLSNACRWDNILQNNGYFVTTTPTSGAIAHWNNNDGNGVGAAGHVAFVESVQSNGVPVLSHYNWNPLCGWTTTNNINAPRYIRFNRFELVNNPTIQPITTGGQFNMTANIKNNHSESVTTQIRVALYSAISNQLIGVLDEKTETFSAGQTKSLTFFKSSILSPTGEYKIWIETRVSGSTPFTLVHKYQASSTQTVFITNGSCNPPTTTLTTPASGTNFTVGQNISLQWTGNGNGCSIQDYQIELTVPNGNITSPIQNGTDFSFTAPSNGLGTWQWRARTRNTNGFWGNYTSLRTFTVSEATTNYTITLSSNPTAGGTTSGNGTFASGSSRTVTATASSGYTFKNWTENGSVVTTSNPYTFTLTGNRNLVADFSQWLSCPSYNFSPSNNSNWNTHSSAIGIAENRIYRFLAVPGRVYTFKTGCGNGATADFNTVLQLLDSNCNLITANDNGCEQQRSTIEWTCNYSTTGWVYLIVRGFNINSNFGNYTLAFRETTGLGTIELDNENFEVSPNPFDTVINIKSDTSKIREVQLLDLAGRLILTNKVNNTQEQSVNTVNITSGVYMLKIITDNGEKTVKVIKK